MKDISLTNRLVKGLTILLKSLINLRQNPAVLEKIRYHSHILVLRAGLLLLSSLSASISFLKISCPRTITCFDHEVTFLAVKCQALFSTMLENKFKVVKTLIERIFIDFIHEDFYKMFYHIRN